MKSDILIKLAIGTVLFLTWVALVVLKVPGTEDLIAWIKVGLGGLGIYHSLTTTTSAPALQQLGAAEATFAAAPAPATKEASAPVGTVAAPAAATLQ